MKTKSTKKVYGPDCPACSGKSFNRRDLGVMIFECESCNGIHGDCYLGDSYAMVKPHMSTRTDMDGARYFDFTCVGSQGVTRRHGWFDPATKLILQVG